MGFPPGESAMAVYDAFLSYSHAKGKPIAAALQSVVQKLGKPWYRRRALRVFRDDTSLTASPQLWPSIEQALARSRYLILLASPEAAASPWVAKEVIYWLDRKSIDSLLIALTEGKLVWGVLCQGFRQRNASFLLHRLFFVKGFRSATHLFSFIGFFVRSHSRFFIPTRRLLTTARLTRSGRRSEGSLPSGADHRAATLYSVGL